MYSFAWNELYHLKDDPHLEQNRPTVKNLCMYYLDRGVCFRDSAGKTFHGQRAECGGFEPKGGVDGQRFVGSQFCIGSA